LFPSPLLPPAYPLLSGPYLVVATKRTLVGKIQNDSIYEASEFEVLPFSKSMHHLTESQVYGCMLCAWRRRGQPLDTAHGMVVFQECAGVAHA